MRRHGAARHEEEKVRALIEEKLGDIIFGVDDTDHGGRRRRSTVVARADPGRRRVTDGRTHRQPTGQVAGASAWFRGGVVSYASQVKFDVLGVPEGPVVRSIRPPKPWPWGCATC